METYRIEIRHADNYTAIEVSGNTPCLLADEIRRTVERFYKR